MSRRKWVSAYTKGDQEVAPLTEQEKERLGDEEIVLLLSGFNNFGDKIYNYLKAPLKNIETIVRSVEGGGRFDLREYGEVIAAGLGMPTEEVRREIEGQYRMINFPKKEETES